MTDALPVAALAVKDGEIPLPPPEMWAELDNSGAPAEKAAPAAAAAPTQAAPTVAVLEFVGDDLPFRRITLRYPFRFNGVVHTEVVVHRMTVAQLGAFWDGLPDDGSFDRTDAYGLMCGFPGAVIRALPDPDGPTVTSACFDFLPRALGGASD